MSKFPSSVTPTSIAAFRKIVLGYHAQAGRHTLPWRITTDAYAIAVSEIMLQQTQVDRVIPKFNTWMKRFPTAQQLAKAEVSEVLTLWQGLGYNRRAIGLQKMAQKVVEQYAGVFPTSENEIINLPGIGPYTAGAITAFAFNRAPQPPAQLMETNVRTALLYHFYSKTKRTIHDSELAELSIQILGKQSPRTWYSALMDYGTHLKKTLGKQKTSIHQKSAHYTKQSKFEGSQRQLRAAIVRYTLQHPEATLKDIEKHFSESPYNIPSCIEGLVRDGLVSKTLRP